MRSQDTVQLGAQPFDRTPTLPIHKMSTELHCDTAEIVEGMRQQEQLRFSVEGGSLYPLRIPRRSNFNSSVVCVNVRICRHSDGQSGVGIDNCERKHSP